MAKLIQVIETQDRRGSGTEDDPHRFVKQFWSVDGDLLMERDDWMEEFGRRTINADVASITARVGPV